MEIASVDPSRHGHAGPDTPEIAARYARRNRLIWSAFALAHEAGVPAGVGYDPADPRPVVVYIDLPDAGQISWHLPAYPGEWDGHSTSEKYRRLERFAGAGARVNPAPGELSDYPATGQLEPCMGIRHETH